MIRLIPNQEEQTFSIIPSSYDAEDIDNATLSLIENGTGKVQQSIDFIWQLSANENYVEISLLRTEECNTYTASNPTTEPLTWAFVTCSGLPTFVTVDPESSLTREDVGELGGATAPELVITLVGEVNTVGAELKEDAIYTLELSTDTKVLYKDMVYVTANTDKKVVFSYPERYTERSNGADEYIVL